MGMIGRWIDSLTDEDRDAIIQHPDPSYPGLYWRSNKIYNFRIAQNDSEYDCGCLVGTVIMSRFPEIKPELTSPYTMFDLDRGLVLGDLDAADTAHEVGCRFPSLTNRFTPERIWKLVKQRAAKGNNPKCVNDTSDIRAPRREGVTV